MAKKYNRNKKKKQTIGKYKNNNLKLNNDIKRSFSKQYIKILKECM